MDRLAYYRQCVQQLLAEQVAGEPETPNIDSQLIFDKERDRYLWLDLGWQNFNRVYACFIHLEIKNGKIWIQRNQTEADIAQILVNMGIPKEDIVLGLQPLYKRPYTGYGTGDLAATPSLNC